MSALAGLCALVALVPFASTMLVLAVRESGRGHRAQADWPVE
jgi:hypothetical protein